MLQGEGSFPKIIETIGCLETLEVLRGRKFGSSMIRGSTAIGKEYFKNVPESKLYFYIACLRNIKMLLYLRSINILLAKEYKNVAVFKEYKYIAC